MEQFALVMIFIASVGVAEPEVGTPCEEALAALQGQGLEIVDVDLVERGILHTMVKKGTRFFHGRPKAKVALVECQPPKLEL